MHRHGSFWIALAVIVIGTWLAATALSAVEGPAEDPEAGVVAYYFHGATRCATCRKIEAYAGEAIHQGFADQLAAGSLAWRVVNLDEPENRHFVDDFELVSKTVVLAEYDGGAIVRWQKLDKVWQLVRTKDAFIDYVQGETSEFLGAE